MSDKKFKLSWGDPRCIRDALSDTYGLDLQRTTGLEDLNYCSLYEGNQELRDNILNFVKFKCRAGGYKYILITAGATQALNIVLRTFRDESSGKVYTNEYYFSYYKDIIEKNELEKVSIDYKVKSPTGGLAIIDSPSNPFGDNFMGSSYANITVWDAVYHSPTYMNNAIIIPIKNDIMIGSMSKSFGVPGLRIGWIATNNISIYEKLLHEVKYENATISNYSQVLANQILSNDKLDNFLTKSNSYLNDNREEFSKIEYLTNTQVPLSGMFMTGDLDIKALDVLEKASIDYTDLDIVDNIQNPSKKIRFNMGQSRELVKAAIRNILKIDGKI